MSTDDTRTRVTPEVPGIFSHLLSDDGLTLTSSWETPAGVFTSTMSWKDLPTAEAHYWTAVRGFEAKAADLRVGVGERRTARVYRAPGPMGRLGSIAVIVSTGPPTWWKPNVGVKWLTWATEDPHAARAGTSRVRPGSRRGFEVRGGWLRVAAQVAIVRGR